MTAAPATPAQIAERERWKAGMRRAKAQGEQRARAAVAQLQDAGHSRAEAITLAYLKLSTSAAYDFHAARALNRLDWTDPDA